MTLASLAESLRRNHLGFDKLDLSEALPASQLNALGKAFRDNTTVRSVYLRRPFLRNLSRDERQRIIQAVATLRYVTDISIVMPHDDESVIPVGTVASMLRQAQHLKKVELCCMQIPSMSLTEDEIQDLSHAIRAHPSLQEVSLWLLQLTDPCISLDPMLQALARVRTLERIVVDLRTSQPAPFTRESLQELCRCPALQTLTLGQIDLQDDDVLAMTTELQTSSVLVEHGLCGCNLSPKAVTTIAQMLETNTTLTRLELTENPNLGDAGCIAIARALRKNESFTRLFLVDNPGMSNAGYQALVEMLRDNHHLENVSLDCTAHDLMTQMDHYLQLNLRGSAKAGNLLSSALIY